jgi:hypothetical protein
MICTRRAHVKGRADLVVLVVDVEGALLGQVEERREFGGPFRLVVDGLGRVGKVVGEVLVELVVLLLADLALVLEPDCLARVQRLDLRRLDALFLLLGVGLAASHRHHHRVLDEVGVLLDHLAQFPLLQILLPLLLEVEDDVGAAPLLADVLEGVAAVGLRLPADRLVGGSAGAAGEDRDLVGNHECRVEADAELADQFRVVLVLAALQQLEELLGPRVGDGTEGLGGLVAAQADAVVAHRQGAGLGIGDQFDSPLVAVGVDGGVGEGQVAGLVDGVAGVGDQLAQEDLLVRVEGMDHQVEDLVDLGLELALAYAHASVSPVGLDCRWGGAQGKHPVSGCQVQGKKAGGGIKFHPLLGPSLNSPDSQASISNCLEPGS